jgi:hypothetical protein
VASQQGLRPYYSIEVLKVEVYTLITVFLFCGDLFRGEYLKSEVLN